MKKPTIISGSIHKDNRGKVFHVNNFDLTPIKRIYIIENKDLTINRGWKGHLVENRWFYCTKGEIEIQVVPISNLSIKSSAIEFFKLSDKNLNILFVPKGFATLIKQSKKASRITAMSDYLLGESDDENLRWKSNIFKA
tara:strand:+ start:23523 stop:23939 length:417 start_codon:yes stop_codon:yes gene_type:complete